MKHGVVPRQLLAGPEGPTRSVVEERHLAPCRGSAGSPIVASAAARVPESEGRPPVGDVRPYARAAFALRRGLSSRRALSVRPPRQVMKTSLRRCTICLAHLEEVS